MGILKKGKGYYWELLTGDFAFGSKAFPTKSYRSHHRACLHFSSRSPKWKETLFQMSSDSITADWHVKTKAPSILTPLNTMGRPHGLDLRQVFLARCQIIGFLWKSGLCKSRCCGQRTLSGQSGTTRAGPPENSRFVNTYFRAGRGGGKRYVWGHTISCISHYWEQVQRWGIFTAPIKYVNVAVLVESNCEHPVTDVSRAV